MTKRSGRTQPCDRTHARARLDNAQKALEIAELVAGEDEIPASRSVAAALAVLSGIASADAACCAALGRRSRGEDHREAAVLLRQIVPAGDRAAKTLIELLNLKDTAQYGLIPSLGANLPRHYAAPRGCSISPTTSCADRSRRSGRRVAIDSRFLPR